MHPLSLRITKDRKQVYISLGINLPLNEWDEDKQRVKKSHANSVRLNNMLAKKLAEASDKAIEAETNDHNVSSKALGEKVKHKGGKSFFTQAEAYLKQLKDTGNFNCYTADKPRIKHFREFMKGANIILPEVTEPLLRRFKIYLQTKHTIPLR